MKRDKPEYDARIVSDIIDAYIHNEKYRNVMRDRLIDGLTYGEIAKKRGYCERNIGYIISRCEAKIFSHLP